MESEEEIIEPGLTKTQVVGSAATEIGAAVGGEFLAKAISASRAAARAKKDKNKKRVEKAGAVMKAGVRFASGALGSFLAQKGVEDKEELGLGRMLLAGAANAVPIGDKLGVEPGKVALKTGIVAGAERAGIGYFDEGEIDPVDTLMAAGTGGLLGGAIAKVDAKYLSTAHKVLGKDADEIDRMISVGELTDDDVASALKNVLTRDATEREIKKTRNRLEREFLANNLADKETPIRSTLIKARNYFLPEKTIGPEAREGYFKYKDSMERAEAISTRLQQRVDKEVISDPGIRDDIVNYLAGGEMTNKLAQRGISGDLRQMREIEIESMSDMYDLFETTDQFNILPPEVQNTLKARMQTEIDRGYRMYDTKSYRAFYNKKWNADAELKAEASEEVFDSLFRKAVANGEEVDEKALRKMKSDTKKHMEHLESMFVSQAPSSSKELVSSLPGRMEIVLDGHMPGPRERAFLGEVTSNLESPGVSVKYRLRDTIRHKAAIESQISVMNSLKETGQLSTKSLPGYVPLKLPGNSGKNKNGDQLFIPVDTDHAIGKLHEKEFADQLAEGTSGVINQLYGSLVGLSKAAKVIYNPPSYSVNAIGGALSMASNNVHPLFKNGKLYDSSVFKDYFRGANLASAELDGLYGKVTKKSKAETRKALIADIDEAYKYGIGNASIASNEVSDAIANGKIGNLSRKLTDSVGKAYNITDTATRYAIWKSNQNMITRKLVKNGVSMTEDQVKRMAASITNDTYQNYARTNRLGKLLSRKGILPPFVTFTLELFRNTTNQIRYAYEMIQGDKFAKRFGFELNDAARSALASEGRARLAALTAVLGVSAGATSLIGTGSDYLTSEQKTLDPDKKDDFRFFSPEYIRNKDFHATFNEKTKTGTFAATSYLFPHATITQMLAPMGDAILNGEEDEYETARTLSNLFVQEFLGEGTFINQNLMRAIDNRKETGKTVSDNPGWQGFLDRMKFFVFESFKPGFANEFEKFANAYADRGDFTPSEIWLRQAGLRFQKIDMTQMAEFRIQDFTKRYSGARGTYTTNLKYKSDELTPEEIERSYREALTVSEEVYKDIEESYNRLDSFGYSTDDKIKILRGGNVKSEDIYRIVNGMDFKPFKRGLSATTGEQYQEFTVGRDESEIKREINRMKRGTPTEAITASRFERERNRIKNDERKGRTPKDKLLMNMDVVSRAQMLIDMGVNQDRSLYFEYKRKGVITKDVRMLLRRAR